MNATRTDLENAIALVESDSDAVAWLRQADKEGWSGLAETAQAGIDAGLGDYGFWRCECCGECISDPAAGLCVTAVPSKLTGEEDGDDWYCELCADATKDGCHGCCDRQHAVEIQAELDREEAEHDKFCREEAELIERDEQEMRLIEQGIAVEWCECDTIQDAADELGMPSDSKTARLYFERMLPRAEAERRAGKIRHRHEETDYDALLSRGVDKDTARDLIR